MREAPDLAFSHIERVDDGDHAGVVGTAAAGAVWGPLFVRGAGRDGSRQLGHHLTHHGQARLESLK